jgi:hypothetical protein
MKNSTKIYYVGIDVCKEKLDVHCQQWGKSRVFPNNLKGIRALLTTLRKLGKTLGCWRGRSTLRHAPTLIAGVLEIPDPCRDREELYLATFDLAAVNGENAGAW